MKPIAYIFLLFLSSPAPSSSFVDEIPPLPPHMFLLVWPPAYGRTETGINWYRQALDSDYERARFLEHFNRDFLQGPDPFGNPPSPPPPWMLQFWLPANFSWGRMDDHRQRKGPPLQAAKALKIDQKYGDVWMDAVALNPPRGTSHRQGQIALYRRLWDRVSTVCRLRGPIEYFRWGAELVRRQLPIGEWFAEWGVTPDDTYSYLVREIEEPLVTKLGDHSYFHLLCNDMNHAELSYTPNDPRIPWANSYIRQDHPRPPTMLAAIVICVDPDWAGPPSKAYFAPCPQLEMVTNIIRVGELQGCVFNPDSALQYYRTLDDGIERPFMERR